MATQKEFLKVPETLIPHLVIEGRVTLFSGREKIGKSTIVAQMVVEAARGGTVFGIPMQGRAFDLTRYTEMTYKTRPADRWETL